jgi:hypothetical protein
MNYENMSEIEIATACKRKRSNCPIYQAVEKRATELTRLLISQAGRSSTVGTSIILRAPRTPFDDYVIRAVRRSLAAEDATVKLHFHRAL